VEAGLARQHSSEDRRQCRCHHGNQRVSSHNSPSSAIVPLPERCALSALVSNWSPDILAGFIIGAGTPRVKVPLYLTRSVTERPDDASALPRVWGGKTSSVSGALTE
jgi:hypothetical protein